ncbi:MAG: hypothetical protein WD070_06065 [Pirellulaceae bacterium]
MKQPFGIGTGETLNHTSDAITRGVMRQSRTWSMNPGITSGAFKSFPVEEDEHFTTVCRYVERNGLRANLAGRAEGWRWSSLWHRVKRSRGITLDKWPVARRRNWISFVSEPETEAELQALRRSLRRGTPFGTTDWQQETAKRIGLESSLREPGRPPQAKGETLK